jgi:diguanylate cyclase (GGDEF)-like protein
MNQAESALENNAFLEERIRYLEEANCTYVSILDMLASSENFQTELNRGKSVEAIFHATLAQLKRLLPFQGMGILENLEDSSFALAISDPPFCRDELLVDIDNLVMEGSFSWALNRNQSIIVPAASGRYTLLLHVIATQSRIRGMFVGRLPVSRKTIDSPSLNALTITLRTTAHALESFILYAMLREHVQNLEQTVRERTKELETTALELKRSNERLVVLSDTDSLTHLYNRRFLMEELKRKILQAKQNTQCLSLIILDIDDFKKINDTFGHQNGDLVIITVADVSRKKMRGHDIVARYGGEEFVIILPETPLSDAVLIAERLRESVQTKCFPPPMEVLTVTLSLGVATFPSALVDSSEALIRQADEALYLAKHRGRNRVEVIEVPA